MESKETVSPDAGCRDLWKAVLEQAFKDAQGRVGTYEHKKDARRWFRSNRKEIGSFLWVCEVLDLDPKATLARLGDGGPITLPHMPMFSYLRPVFAAEC